MGEHEKAVADYDEALRLRPDYTDASYNRGNAYSRIGEHEKALADYNEALRLKPDYLDVLHNMACLYSLKMDVEQCLSNLEKAVSLDDKSKQEGQTDPDLEWARQDERVRKLLGME